jgi:hypothetical protein
MSRGPICPNCLVGAMSVFHSVSAAPANSCLLLRSRAEAAAFPRGDIALGWCPHCGFISNTAYEARLTEYSERYEETQGFSGTFQTFHRRLAEDLISRYGLRRKTILEIGCGKGEFLSLLCEIGANRGLGFDPAYVPARGPRPARGEVTFIRDFYSEKYRDHAADVIVCKMTLEHIQQTAAFLQMVRRAGGGDRQTLLFFQVPDATRIIRDCAFEDVYYEHCSYFSPASLEYLFRACGYRILRVGSEYGGQYLTIEAEAGVPPRGDPASRPASTRATGIGSAPPLSPGSAAAPTDACAPVEGNLLGDEVASFEARFAAKRDRWRDRLDRWRDVHRKIVLWGSGSKGVAFLTTLRVSDEIACAVDVNPHRQGYHMPGSGHRIEAPEFLREYDPDIVLIMNAIYRREIATELQDLGLSPRLLTLEDESGPV